MLSSGHICARPSVTLNPDNRCLYRLEKTRPGWYGNIQNPRAEYGHGARDTGHRVLRNLTDLGGIGTGASGEIRTPAKRAERTTTGSQSSLGLAAIIPRCAGLGRQNCRCLGFVSFAINPVSWEIQSRILEVPRTKLCRFPLHVTSNPSAATDGISQIGLTGQDARCREHLTSSSSSGRAPVSALPLLSATWHDLMGIACSNQRQLTDAS